MESAYTIHTMHIDQHTLETSASILVPKVDRAVRSYTLSQGAVGEADPSSAHRRWRTFRAQGGR